MKLKLRRSNPPEVFTPSVAPAQKADERAAMLELEEYRREKGLDRKTQPPQEDPPLMTLLPDGTIKGNPDGKWEVAGKIAKEGTRG